jgi:hypothetical protein
MITLSEQVDAAKIRAKIAIERATDNNDPMSQERVRFFIQELYGLYEKSPPLLQGRIKVILKRLETPIAIQIAVPTQDMSLPDASICY